MNHSDMVAKLAKSGRDILGSVNAADMHLIHMAIGICGEVAELLSAVLAGDRVNTVEELGDLEFYYEGLCQGAGIDNDRYLPTSVIYEGEPIHDLVVKSGEVLDLVKKVTIYQDPAKIPELRIAMIKFRETLNEVYVLTEVTFEEALAENIAKLSKRYDGFNYSDEAAQARADKVASDE